MNKLSVLMSLQPRCLALPLTGRKPHNFISKQHTFTSSNISKLNIQFRKLKVAIFRGMGGNLFHKSKGWLLVWATPFTEGSALKEAAESLQVNISSQNVANVFCLIYNLALTL